MNRVEEHGERNIDQPAIYEIRLQGHLNKSWSSWLEGMEVNFIDGQTILKGKVIDQVALRGLLSKIWDLNQTLIAINRIG
ncbi:MAG: hypothetical protein PHU23_01635 [Dehalococcoidales bacterium]|nr:hypothetical protein [Dehalococcoidales bacterium]